jgi:hypothetical protein
MLMMSNDVMKLAELLPEGVCWGEPLTPDVVAEIAASLRSQPPTPQEGELLTDEEILNCFRQAIGKDQTDYMQRVGRSIEQAALAQQAREVENLRKALQGASDLANAIREERDELRAQLADKTTMRAPVPARPILYTDTIKGNQCCRDDMWAVTTEELNRLAEQKASAGGDGWIAWNGQSMPNEYPESEGVLVCIRTRSGAEPRAAFPVEEYDWSHIGRSADIIAYRILAAAPSPQAPGDSVVEQGDVHQQDALETIQAIRERRGQLTVEQGSGALYSDGKALRETVEYWRNSGHLKESSVPQAPGDSVVEQGDGCDSIIQKGTS